MPEPTPNPALSSGLAPIARQQIPDEVARRIQRMIAERRMPVGDRLPPERELALALGIGRGAVREGIKLLAARGIVDVRQGAGTFVRRPQSLVLLDSSHLGSEERRAVLAQATHVRRITDCAAVELAATAASDEALAEIRRDLERAESEPERTRHAFALDLTFEAMLGQASGNPYLAAVQAEAHRYFRAAWEGMGYIPRPATERSAQHWAILRAVEARDPAAARALMEQHLDLQVLADPTHTP